MKTFLFNSYYQGDKKFFSYLIAVFVMIGSNLIASIPLAAYSIMLGGFSPDGSMELKGGNQNLTFLLMLLPFVGALGGLYLAQKKLHNRTFRSLITTGSSINYSKVLFSFFLWLGLNGVIQIVDYLIEPDLVFRFNLLRFAALSLISIILIPLQTSFEEIFFRGYLMQAIGNTTTRPIIALLITAVSFGAMHLANPEVQAMGIGLSMAYYIGFGVVLGAITLLDNSLELALGFHAANNLFASIFVTFKSSALQTEALFIDEHFDFIRMFWLWACAVVIYLIIVYKKYSFAPLSSLWEKKEKE